MVLEDIMKGESIITLTGGAFFLASDGFRNSIYKKPETEKLTWKR